MPTLLQFSVLSTIGFVATRFIIRGFQDKDFDQVWDLHEKAFQGTMTFLGHGPWDEDLKHIPSVYTENGGAFFVMEERSGRTSPKIIGMGAIKKVNVQTAEIKRMRISPPYQGRGLGGRILHFLEKKAKELGYKKLLLDTTVEQKTALHLYTKNGFREYKRAMTLGMNTIFMKKSLVE